MGWVYLGIFIMVQVIVASVVIYGLKRRLDRELIEAAIEKLSVIKGSDEQGLIVVTSQINLKESWRFSIERIIKHKFSSAEIIFKQDPLLKGGIIINAFGQTLDFSIANRLKNFWQ